jgi:hypothetical protein
MYSMTVNNDFFDRLEALRSERQADMQGTYLGTMRSDYPDFPVPEVRPQDMKIEQALGAVICGDCAQVFPCAHGDGRKTKGN